MRDIPSRPTLILLTVALLFASLLVALTAFKPLPRLIWNSSDSVPIGWYWIEKRQPKIGEIAVVKLEDWPELYADTRGYLPSNVWLLKPVRGMFPAVACRFGRYVFIDGKLVANARNFDHSHRILPRWKGCRLLKFDEVFLIARPSNSFDSRYFGPVKLSQVIGVARRLRFYFE